MIIPKKPSNEKQRIEALYDSHILDSGSEAEFDNLTTLAGEICKVPIALVTMIDTNRQWFKSKIGLDEKQTARDLSFCAHAILTPNDPLIINDARKDKRFAENPFVTNKEKPVIFYAGIPILSKEGLPLGTLCVIDHKPKKLEKFQLKALKTLAKQLEQLIELHKAKVEIENSHFALRDQLQKLKTFKQVLDEAVIFASTDRNGIITHANERFTEISGYSEGELIGKSFEIIDSNQFDGGFWNYVKNTIKSGSPWKGRVKYSNKNGNSYWVKSTIIPLQNKEGELPTEYFLFQKDITELVHKEQMRVNEVNFQHEKKYEGISNNLREGIAQSIAGLRFHLIAMESQIKNGNKIQEESILALKDILKELMAETNDLAFDIMPHSLMKKGIREALHSLFNRLESDFDAEIDFNDEDLKCFPIVKSAEIQIYRAIANIYEKALERSKKLHSTFQLLSEPKVGFQLIIEQSDIINKEVAEKIVPTINKIAKQVRLVDGKFSVNYTNNKKTFEIQLTLPKEYTQRATPIEEVVAQ